MKAIKTAIFDLGNVLVFFSLKKMIQQVSDLSGLSIQEIEELLMQKKGEAQKGLHIAYETGQISSEEIYSIFYEASPKTFTEQQFFHAASDIFQPNDLIFPLIKKLKKKGLRLLLLSNTNPAHYEFLTNLLPILDQFDAKILSYEVGASKPDPQIYAAAIEASLCAPKECFYTDDIPEYVTAAKAHGLNATLYTDVPSLEKVLEQV